MAPDMVKILFHKDSVNEGLSQRLLKITKQWLVILPKQPKHEKFHSQRAFFVKGCWACWLPVLHDSREYFTASVVKKLEKILL